MAMYLANTKGCRKTMVSLLSAYVWRVWFSHLVAAPVQLQISILSPGMTIYTQPALHMTFSFDLQPNDRGDQHPIGIPELDCCCTMA